MPARAAVQRAAEAEALCQDTGRESELPAIRCNLDFWKAERDHYEVLREVVLAMLQGLAEDGLPVPHGAAYIYLNDAERVTGLSRRALLGMVRRGEVEAVLVGNKYMVSTESLSTRFPNAGGLL